MTKWRVNLHGSSCRPFQLNFFTTDGDTAIEATNLANSSTPSAPGEGIDIPKFKRCSLVWFVFECRGIKLKILCDCFKLKVGPVASKDVVMIKLAHARTFSSAFQIRKLNQTPLLSHILALRPLHARGIDEWHIWLLALE